MRNADTGPQSLTALDRDPLWGDPGVIYKPIPSRPGYFAGSDGSVWSIKGTRPIKRKPGLAGKNRDRFYICFAPYDSAQVPHLVLEAFVGPKPEGLECCHHNGDSTDNTLSNLRWDTRQSNMDDAKRHGSYRRATKPRGERHYKAKLTESAALRIVAMDATGATMRAIASEFGVTISAIRNVLHGKTWTHVTGLTQRDQARRRRPPKK